MSTCPNKNLKEWKDLVEAVGEVEAYRDYLETKGEIRNPVDVQVKMLNRLDNPKGEYVKPSFLEGLDDNVSDVLEDMLDGTIEVEESIKNISTLIKRVEGDEFLASIDLAKQMSKALDVPFNLISKTQAKVITDRMGKKYDGKSSFFTNGEVYFVEGSLNKDTVFHEFSHPFVRHISVENKKLFNTLYNDLSKTVEGQAIIDEVKENYDLKEDSDLFKEEVIVKALERSASLANINSSKGFVQFIKDLIYALKKIIRTQFGMKQSLKDLSSLTTIEQLSDMLMSSENIELNKNYITQKDIISFNKTAKEIAKELEPLEASEIQELLNAHSKITTNIDRRTSNKDAFSEINEVARNAFNENQIQNLSKMLMGLEMPMGPKVESMSVDELNSKKQGLVNAIIELETIFVKLHSHAKDLNKSDTSDVSMRRVYEFEKIFSQYEDFIDSLNEAVDTSSDTESKSTIKRIAENLRDLSRKMTVLKNMVAMTNSIDVLNEQLVPLNKAVVKKHEAFIQELKDLGAPPEEIERKHRELYGLSIADKKIYDNLKSVKRKRRLTPSEGKQFDALVQESAKGLEIDDAKIELMLNGKLGDMSIYSSFFEGAMTSPDIIVGGLASFVKSAITKYEVKMQAYGNQYAGEVSQLVRNAGMDSQDSATVGKELGFYDYVAIEDENGNIVKKKVRTYLNMFQHYRFDYQEKKMYLKALQDEYQATGSEKDRVAYRTAESEFKKYKYDFFNQEYKREFYEAENRLMSSELGREAKAELDDNGEGLRRASIMFVGRPKEEAEQKKRLLLERQFLHLDITIDGKQKSTKDKKKAKLLRDFKSEKNKFGQYVYKENAFEKALKSHEQYLAENFDIGSDDYVRLRKEWLEENTNRALTDEYRNRVAQVRAELNELYALRPKDDRNKPIEDEISDINIQIFSILNAYKNNHGQPDVSAMEEQTIDELIDLEDKKQLLNDSKVSTNGLTKEENSRFNELHQMKNDGVYWDSKLHKELQSLYSRHKKSDLDLSKKIAIKRAELAGLTSTVSSDEYIAIVNQITTGLTEGYPKEYDSFKVLTAKNSNDFLSSKTLINHLRENSEDFKTWFDENHYEKEFFNTNSRQMETSFVRYSMWNVSVPKDDSYYRAYEVKDENGNHVEYIDGVPSGKYMEFQVDERWHTKKVVGENIDNKGQWLPLTREQNPEDFRYINKDYEEMKARNGDDYILLKYLQNEALKVQEDADYGDKLYYDFPRFFKSGIEKYTTNETTDEGDKVNYLTMAIERTKEFFSGEDNVANTIQRDQNYNPEQNLRDITTLESIGNSIPIQGLYDIQAEEVSNNIVQNHLTYAGSLKKKEALAEISPSVYAIKDVVESSPFLEKHSNNSNFFRKAYSSFRDLTDDNHRFRAIDAFVKVNFEGKKTKEGINSNKVVNNILGLSNSIASFSFFGFNIPSAIKNVYGAKFQTMIEASGGEFFNHIHAQQGNMFAYSAVGDIMFGNSTLHGGEKPYSLQLLDVFDATSQGSFVQDLGKNITLSRGEQLADLTMATSFRRISEKQATMQVFGAMMSAKMVDITDSDGTTTSIKYLDAWEIRDGKMQLREGVDKKHGITYDQNGEMVIGNDFISYRNTIHQVMVKLQGNYADFDQPAAQRYIAFRAISFLRRYFIPMVVDRFGYEGKISDPRARMNVGLGTSNKGTYIIFGQMVARMMRGYNRKVNYMTMEEKIASKKVITEFAMLFLVSTMIAMLGYDDDDPERNKKLRELSGALKIPFLTERGRNEADFDLGGFAQQHLTLGLLNIKSENKQFIPLPTYGLGAYFEMLKPQSISVAPFIGTIYKSIEQLVGTVKGDDSSFYKRDMGPYAWQKKDDAKIFNILLKPFGLTGGAINPSKSAETVDKFSRK